MSQNRHSRYTPLLLALCLITGLLIGTFYTNHFAGNRLSIINTGGNKLNYLLQIIDNNYVDTVDVNTLVEDAMPLILSELDPHSAYIGASDAQESVDELSKSFSGIGVSFVIQQDTIHIMSIIKGGPSEKVGLMAGDRIVRIDGKPYVGQEVTDTGAMRRLKGPKGTEVNLGVRRNGEPGLLSFKVTRGEIPQHTVEAAYLIDEQTGYINISKFGENTFAEMLSALLSFSMNNVRRLIIDLRGNRGGYMHTAIQMANEFLPDNRLVVYTEGRRSPREEFMSDGRGSFKDIPLVVLVDEGSASASEIFAGAIQDNDRGTIVGRRTFGKGLVQQPIEFRDGSIIRLTVARYYTPSGRCIQKPYQKGHGEEYENDLIARYERGEYFSQDSIKQQGPEYHTRLGRIVYGGGGITPDFFVPQDTTGITSYYKEAVFSGLIRQFAFAYTDENRKQLEAFEELADLEKFLKRQGLLTRFASFAEQRGLKRRNLMLYRSQALFERNIFGAIIYNVKNMQTYLQYLNESDPVIRKALEVLDSDEAFPQAPQKEEGKNRP